MSREFQILILSDVHYAGAIEKSRRNDYEYRELRNPFLRTFNWAYRHFLWMRKPLEHNSHLDDLIANAGSPDWVIANGDYNCDTQWVGLSDHGSMQSARECLGKLRERFPSNFRATIGDH